MELSLFIAFSIVFAPPVHNDILTVSIIFKVIRSCFRLIVPLKEVEFWRGRWIKNSSVWSHLKSEFGCN